MEYRGQVRRHSPLYSPDRYPVSHARRGSPRHQIRANEPQGFGVSRRAYQSGGLEVVPRGGWKVRKEGQTGGRVQSIASNLI